MIHFNIPPFVGTEFNYMREAVNNHIICGDGPFTKKCNKWIEKRFDAKKVMLTTRMNVVTHQLVCTRV